MNKVIIIGNLANDPEVRTAQSGNSVCNFRLAVQRRMPNQQGVREADFLNIVAFRHTADFCARYLTKGTRIAVEGSIQNRSYDAQDGSKRYITEIIADNIEFAGSKGADRGPDVADHAAAPARPQPMAQAPVAGGFTEVDDDELPF